MQRKRTEKELYGKGAHETKYRRACMTVWYSVLHMLVDGACALAMFGRFLTEKEGYLYMLLYNFCAFALQMPFGVVLDVLNERNRGRQDYAFYTAVIGVFCTVLGAFTHPVLLGIGNALFHVGGGVGVIREDMASGLSAGHIHERMHLSFFVPHCRWAHLLCRKNGKWVRSQVSSSEKGYFENTRWKGERTANGRIAESWYGQGRGLGVFVAPGALGLYLGTLAAKAGVWKAGFFIVGALLLFLCGILGNLRRQEGAVGGIGKRKENRADAYSQEENLSEYRNVISGKRSLAFCCMFVVILRSFIGMTAGFSWKTGILAGSLATLALVGGKIAGGFAAAGFGVRKTAVVSLTLAAVCYLFSPWMPMGLAAVFLFNMTMPITLYWMVCHMPDQPGFAFGILTFALFLGFLPSYLGIAAVQDGRVIGCVGSLLSMALLAAGMGRKGGADGGIPD